MAKSPTNVAASVRQRLLNLARSEGRDFQTLLVAFGLERLIFRLSKSPHRDKFVLKGGMLVTLWTTDPGRFTRDIDFLAFGDNEDAALTSIFAEILSLDAGDGLKFGIDTITTTDIREELRSYAQKLVTAFRVEVAYRGVVERHSPSKEDTP